jgi:hypothetical protein
VQGLNAWVWHHTAGWVAAVDHVEVFALAPAGWAQSSSAGVCGWAPARKESQKGQVVPRVLDYLLLLPACCAGEKQGRLVE